METRPGWQKALTVWAITSAIIPFAIFAILSVFQMSFEYKILITLGGIVIWLLLLVPSVISDWNQKMRQRLREACKGDALLKIWEIVIDVNDDGSATVSRRIAGTNLAKKREYYEIESSTDPQRDPVYEKQLKDLRKITATVSTNTEKGWKTLYKDKSFPPEVALRVNRVIHEIPMSDSGVLKENDPFEIQLKEQVEKDTFKISGDLYQLRVRHLSEKLRIVFLLPKQWHFPSSLPPREKLATAEMKDPTCGEWRPTTEQPEIGTIKDRARISVEIDNPQLLSIYMLSYHAMQHSP